MSQKQLNRFSVITKLIDKLITVKEAALCLGLSERQVKRLKKGVSIYGAAFLIHKDSNHKPKHAISDEIVSEIIKLKLSEKYINANFKHFQELLLEHEGIDISYGALHEILTAANIKSPKKRRRFKPHRRRKRKLQEGLLVQMDATPFEWFDTKQKFSLHGAIDDATGKIVGLYMTKNECLHGYFQTVKQIILNNGIPASIYADRHAIFLSQKASRLSIEDLLAGESFNDTQFSRAMKELGITLIAARSPQAKGRVERLWETLQSRLPVEFKIHNITTIDGANVFLAQYIDKFNALFSVLPEESESAYIELLDRFNIDEILCIKQERILDNGLTFSFHNRSFKLIADNVPPKTKIDVLINPIFGIRAQYSNNTYEVITFIKPKKQASSDQSQKKSTGHTPPDSHYFKYGQSLMPKVIFDETDEEIFKMLEDIFLRKYA